MFDWLLPEDHAIVMLKKDHDAVRALFDIFEKADSAALKNKIIVSALAKLKIHAVLEEDGFYPAVRQHIGGKIMNEADAEHHLARILIAELDSAGGGGDHRHAKFT